jgi:hypothetical protein
MSSCTTSRRSRIKFAAFFVARSRMPVRSYEIARLVNIAQISAGWRWKLSAAAAP